MGLFLFACDTWASYRFNGLKEKPCVVDPTHGVCGGLFRVGHKGSIETAVWDV